MSAIITNDNNKTNPTVDKTNTAVTDDHVAATTNRTGTRNRNLKFVDNLAEYTVHHDDVDIRGFDVRLSTGEKIGEVEGLLADVPSRLVRYAEIEVEDDVIGRHTAGDYTEDDKHVLVPIGLVKINTDKTVTIFGIGLNQMVDYPRYNRTSGYGYTTDYELTTNKYLGGFHEYSNDDFVNTIGHDRYQQTDAFDDTFYSSKFYTGKFTK